MTRPLSVAVIGAGTMGANHVRVVAEHPDAVLAAIVDTDRERADALAHRFGTQACSSIEALPACDAVIVAAPTEAHAELARSLSDRGLPMLIEKPLSDQMPKVEHIIDEARARSLPLMCGFVERFNPAITAAIDQLDEEPIHVVIVRHSPATPRIQTSVVHDLLIHDIDLALRMHDKAGISSTTWSTWQAPSGVVDLVDCTLTFESGQLATLSSSRTSQRKIRSLSIATTNSLVEVDLLRHDVTVYRHRFHNLERTGPDYQAETIIDIPFVRHKGEPLALQLTHFLKLIRGDADRAAELDTLALPHALATRIAGSPRSDQEAPS
jgi:predicted dehydrogenase